MAKNIKDLLLDVTKYPAAIEAALPAGAPKISTMMADAAASIPAIPDLPIELPDLPAAPALPAAPVATPGLGRYVTGVEIAPRGVITPTPTGRRIIPFVFE